MRTAPPSPPRAARRRSASASRPRSSASTTSIRGEVEFDNALLGDFVIVRADGIPLYHFVVVIDDQDMEHHPRHPRRGSPLEHAQAHRPHPGTRLPRAAVRAHPADPQSRSVEDEQAQEPDGDHRLPRAGVPPRGHGQLPGLPRLVARAPRRRSSPWTSWPSASTSATSTRPVRSSTRTDWTT